MAYIAASHQETLEMFWLHFKGALMLSIVISQSVVITYRPMGPNTSGHCFYTYKKLICQRKGVSCLNDEWPLIRSSFF